jgi:hypothetical protein
MKALKSFIKKTTDFLGKKPEEISLQKVEKSDMKDFLLAIEAIQLDYAGDVKLSELIGQKIIDLQFKCDNIEGIEFLDTFITLENGQIITLPSQDSDETSVVNLPLNVSRISKYVYERVVGYKIKNFYSVREIKGNIKDFSSFIELENNFYLQERKVFFGGAGVVDLFLYSEKEFKEKTKEWILYSNLEVN